MSSFHLGIETVWPKLKQTFKYLPILILFDITFYAISLFEKSEIFIYFKKNLICMYICIVVNSEEGSRCLVMLISDPDKKSIRD